MSKGQVFITAIMISLRTCNVKPYWYKSTNIYIYFNQIDCIDKGIKEWTRFVTFPYVHQYFNKGVFCCWFHCSLHRHGSAWSGKISVSLPGKQRCLCWGLPDIPLLSLGVRRRDVGLCAREDENCIRCSPGISTHPENGVFTKSDVVLKYLKAIINKFI